MHKIKRFLLVLIAIFSALCIYYWEEITYGVSQGTGQLKIIWNSRPIEEVMADRSFPDTLKAKIRLIQEIRQFTIDSLGLEPSENYTTLYDQKGKPILWVVTASAPFELKAKEWSFPFLGSFSYKGFFEYEKAQKAESELKEKGWDTDIDEVSAWSTLGWFKDPVLSSMLKRSTGSLANLIIHEITHGTLYIKDNIKFNENLANFVGDKGARRFLAARYGKESREYREYIEGRKFVKEYRERVLRHGKSLDSLYKAISDLEEKEKINRKRVIMNEIKSDLLLFIENSGRKTDKMAEELSDLNNAYFLDYRRYNEEQDQFEEELENRFNGDLKSYISHLKNLYPSL